MERNFGLLNTELFDLIIIGGGIIGSGIARDASLRGLKTLLLEKEDFAHGTTANSSRLLHGGLRYLRSLQLQLVHYDLKEREILLRIAPHLVRRLPFIIPLRRNDIKYHLSLPLGLFLYDLLAVGQKVPHWRRLSVSEATAMEASLDHVSGLSGAYLYYDCEAVSMERLCLENLLDADQHGACILNYARAIHLDNGGQKMTGIRVEDRLGGAAATARGRIIVNAGGHWADLLWQQFGIGSPTSLRKTKGVHLVTRKLTEQALVLFAKSDGRLFFVIPWGEFSLIGTTDTDYQGDPDLVYATLADADYLVKETALYFPGFNHSQVYYTMAGLRPLVCKENVSASATSRAHRIIDHAHLGAAAIISVLGGKITAHRGIAEETVDLVCRKLNIVTRCSTGCTPLPGAPAVDPAEIDMAAAEFSLPVETIQNLAGLYGTRFRLVLDQIKENPRLAAPIRAGRPYIAAQVRWAVKNEAALTLSDFMLRRSLMGYEQDRGLPALDTIVDIMSIELGWDEAERRHQIQGYIEYTERGQMFRKG